jgi:hypothetical protein
VDLSNDKTGNTATEPRRKDRKTIDVHNVTQTPISHDPNKVGAFHRTENRQVEIQDVIHGFVKRWDSVEFDQIGFDAVCGLLHR